MKCNCNNRETEDLLSSQYESYCKEQKQNEFRDRIRREVEERQRQEASKRELKKRQAEERRQAVLDRIKRKKEEEEERVRQAERERQLIEEEKQRVIRVRLWSGKEFDRHVTFFHFDTLP